MSFVAPPAGWAVEPSADAMAETYASPKTADGARVMLYITAAVVKTRSPDARVAVDDLHDAAHRAELTGGKITVDSWAERADGPSKSVEATLVFRDASAHSLDTRRIVIVADATAMTAVTGECFSRDDADPKLLAACTAALATLDPGVSVAKRVALSLAPASATPAPAPAPTPVPKRPVAAAGSAPADDDLDPPTPPSMSDGPRTPLPPIAVAPADSSTDKRPIYVGAAIVMLGAGLWWNRRRRAQYEREDADSSGDDDADSLRAAAKGDDTAAKSDDREDSK
jgi:hypothetical protein